MTAGDKSNNPNKSKTNTLVNPEKSIPMKPDKNDDPTKMKPGANDPKKNDPTRIDKIKK
jgi:hypothetical protein